MEVPDRQVRVLHEPSAIDNCASRRKRRACGIHNSFAEICRHFIIGDLCRAARCPIARTGRVWRIELISDAKHHRGCVRPALHVDAIQLQLRHPSAAGIVCGSYAIDDAPAVDVGVAATLLRCSRVKVPIRPDTRRDYEASICERQAAPELNSLPVTMMVRNMAFVKPHEARGKVLAEPFLIIEGPGICVRCTGARAVTKQRKLLCVGHGTPRSQEYGSHY